MKLQYFREKESGDYGVIDLDSFSDMSYEGRGSVIEGDPTSVATSEFGCEFLSGYTRKVSEKSVPKKWLKWLKGGN